MVNAIRNENMRQDCIVAGAWPQKKSNINESRDTLSSTHKCHSQGLAGATKEHRFLLLCERDSYRLFVR